MIIGGLQKLSLVDYPGKTSAVIFTIGCNFRCSYCHNPELVMPERYIQPMPIEDIYSFLHKRRGKLDAVTITGGEPTMHEDLPILIADIKSAGFLVKLDSNGTNPEMLIDLINKKMIDYIAMDIKAPIDKYSDITERPINADAIIKSIKIIMESGLDYEFRTTVVKDQLVFDDFERIGTMIKGAKRYALQAFISTKTNNPSFINRVAYSDEDMIKIKNIMSKYVDLCVIH
jgi:pyruvate formate lyase activating enzyme